MRINCPFILISDHHPKVRISLSVPDSQFLLLSPDSILNVSQSRDELPFGYPKNLFANSRLKS